MENKLYDLKIYKKAMIIGDEVWELAEKLPNFSKYSTGTQIVDSADSIAANISEGYGRFHFKDSINFYYFSRGSAYETLTWLRKLRNRKLISDDIYSSLSDEIHIFIKQLNAYIRFLKNNQPNNQ